MRGIEFAQLPTSLLAMVDSSVGGKVGLDLPEGKNLVGSFLRPRIVVADLGWLETLPAREVSCGLAEDELEKGRRAILNYGHTIGHGLEAAAGYALPHGEAISTGMVAAAHLSRERLGADLVTLHEDLLSSAGLPLRAPAVETGKVLAAMGTDKKRRTGEAQHRFVLLEDVGRPVWGVPVAEEEARRAIGAVV